MVKQTTRRRSYRSCQVEVGDGMRSRNMFRGTSRLPIEKFGQIDQVSCGFAVQHILFVLR